MRHYCVAEVALQSSVSDVGKLLSGNMGLPDETARKSNTSNQFIAGIVRCAAVWLAGVNGDVTARLQGVRCHAIAEKASGNTQLLRLRGLYGRPTAPVHLQIARSEPF